MCAKFLRSLCIISLVVSLSSSQLHARSPNGAGMGKAVREFITKVSPSGYATLLVPPISLTTVLGMEGLVLGTLLGCVVFAGVTGSCAVLERESPFTNTPDKTEEANNIDIAESPNSVEETDNTEITRGDEFVNEAIAKSYAGTMVHYTENISDNIDRPIMSDYIDRVIRTVHDEAGEILVLQDGHEIRIAQVEGVGSSVDYFGDLFAETVFFSTTAAQPLNELANRLVSKGHGIVKGKAEYFFNNGKIVVEVKEHGLSDGDDVKIYERAQFLIARDKLLLKDE